MCTYGTARNSGGRHRGSSCMTPGCRPACRGPTSSRGAADETLNACGGHIGCCRACDGRGAAGSSVGCPATPCGWPASAPTRGSMSTPVTSSRVDGTWAWPASLTRSTRSAPSAKRLRSRTLWRLHGDDRLRERLAQDRQDMAAALGEFIQKAHAMVGQRHLSRHRHVAAAEQPRIREGMVGRAIREGRDHRRAGAGEAGDAVAARGLKGFSQRHRRHTVQPYRERA